MSVLLRQPHGFEGVLPRSWYMAIRSIAPSRMVQTHATVTDTSIPSRPLKWPVLGTTTRSPASMNSWGSIRMDSQFPANSSRTRRT